MIAPRHLEGSDQLRERFQSAQPFEHVCIDGFFEPEIAQGLLADFPAFAEEAAADEFGRVGRKAVNTALAKISPTYARAARYLASAPALDAMSAVTGIEELKADPSRHGGGAHENLDGHDLDPHVDLNYDGATGRHRRLNPLVYLNPVWEDDWGGLIERHCDPWTPERSAIRAFAPIFNQAVIFATSEHSWHDFNPIRLPADPLGALASLSSPARAGAFRSSGGGQASRRRSRRAPARAGAGAGAGAGARVRRDVRSAMAGVHPPHAAPGPKRARQ